MEILFRNQKLQAQCESDRNRKRAFGDMADVLNRRLNDLAAADCLEDTRHLPGRCHELTGNRKGQLAMRLSGNVRIVFQPADDPVPTRDDGSLDWTRVKRIRVLEVKDYHDE